MTPEHRAAAISAAVELHRMVGGLHTQCGVDRAATVAQAEQQVRATADLFAAWIAGPAHLYLIPGPVVQEATGLPTGTTTQEGATMQINTGQKFSLTARATDAAGYPTTADITLSVDNADVVSLTQDEGGVWWVISGAPGESVVTASIAAGEGGEPLTARLVVDVVPDDAVTIELVPGDVVDE